MAKAEIIPYEHEMAIVVYCEGNGVAGMRVKRDETNWPNQFQVFRCRHCGRTHRFTKRSAAVAQ